MIVEDGAFGDIEPVHPGRAEVFAGSADHRPSSDYGTDQHEMILSYLATGVSPLNYDNFLDTEKKEVRYRSKLTFLLSFLDTSSPMPSQKFKPMEGSRSPFALFYIEVIFGGSPMVTERFARGF